MAENNQLRTVLSVLMCFALLHASAAPVHADVAPPSVVETVYWTYQPLIIGGAVVIAAAVLLWVYYRKKK